MLEASGFQNARSRKRLYLVDHICQQTLYFIVFQPPVFHFTAQPYRCSEFSNRDSRPAYGWSSFIFSFFEASGEENFPKQVTQRNVTAALEGKIYAALDEFIFTSGESCIEPGQVGSSDAAAERGEKGAETWIRAQKV